MAKELVHQWVKTSWWDGSVTVTCGLKFKDGGSNAGMFAKLTCPGCIAVLNAR